MRLSVVAFTLIAFGLVSASASEPELAPRASVLSSRDFTRKMEVRNPKKHHKQRGETLLTDAKFTWYGGGQLDNPACDENLKVTNDMMAVAVPESSPAKCNDQVHLHYNGKMVAAKVVDKCAGCDHHQFDLTQGTFKKLAGLDQGEIHGAHVRIIPQ